VYCAISVAEVNSTSYWRDAFQSVFKSKQLTEYTVMDIEPIMEKDRVQFPGQGQISYKVCPIRIILVLKI